MEFLFTGANGFLGRHLASVARAEGFCAIPWQRSSPGAGAESAPLDDVRAVHAALRRHAPAALLHLAACADVERCRQEPALARSINSAVPELLARACAETGVRFVHISTDMVFDGTRAPYTEGDPVAPVSIYGRSKAEGEARVLAANEQALIVRLPLLFGSGFGLLRGASVPLQLALRRGETVRLFHDERRSALHAGAAARSLLQLLRIQVHGLLHVGATTALSRYELGIALAKRHGWPTHLILPVAQASVPSAEPRPADLELDVQRALALGIALPTALESAENDDEHPEITPDARSSQAGEP